MPHLPDRRSGESFRPPTSRSLLTTACLLGSLSLLSAAFAAARFDITQISGPGNLPAYPEKISDNGHVVGTFATAQTKPGGGRVGHAFRWLNGAFTEIPTLAGAGPAGATSEAFGLAVNENGEVVGISETSQNGPSHAFLYKNGQTTDLHSKFGGIGSQALGISNDGTIVGSFDAQGGDRRAFVVRPNGSVIDLGPGTARSVSNTGFVVGATQDDDGNEAPFVFRDANNNGTVEAGELVLLGTLGSAINNVAVDVNDSGKVVGVCADGAGKSHAVLWTNLQEGAVPQDLGNLGNFAAATGINNVGQIVGTSNAHAFLWENGQMKNLDTLIPTEPNSNVPKWQLDYAGGINSKGEIAGQGQPNTQNFATGFRLTAAATPPPPGKVQIRAITLNPNEITLRSSTTIVTATVELTARPPKKARVRLTVKLNGQVMKFPKPLVATLVKKPSGSVGIPFGPASKPGEYEVSASYGGATAKATLKVNPAPPLTIASFTTNKTTVSPGGKITGTVTLTAVPTAAVKVPLTFFKGGQQIPFQTDIVFKKVKKKFKNVASKEFTIPPQAPAGQYEVRASLNGVVKKVLLTVQ